MENDLILLLGMFFTGIMDAVAGEGGLISTPLLIMCGLPPTSAVATNKAVAFLGNIAACAKFYKSKKIRFKELKLIIPLIIVGTIIGIEILKSVSNSFMGKFVPVALSILIVLILFMKKTGIEERKPFKLKFKKITTVVAFIIIGIYDGFFGAASGAFMTLTFILVLGFDLIDSLATSRFLNLIICAVATIMLIPSGLLNYEAIFFAAAGRMSGAYFGTYIAVTKGASYIKPIFLIALILATVQLFIKYYI